MDTRDDHDRPAVTVGAVTAVLDLAGRQRDAAAPVPASWDEVVDQVRAVVVVPPLGGIPGQHDSTRDA